MLEDSQEYRRLLFRLKKSGRTPDSFFRYVNYVLEKQDNVVDLSRRRPAEVELNNEQLAEVETAGRHLTEDSRMRVIRRLVLHTMDKRNHSSTMISQFSPSRVSGEKRPFCSLFSVDPTVVRHMRRLFRWAVGRNESVTGRRRPILEGVWIPLPRFDAAGTHRLPPNDGRHFLVTDGVVVEGAYIEPDEETGFNLRTNLENPWYWAPVPAAPYLTPPESPRRPPKRRRRP